MHNQFAKDISMSDGHFRQSQVEMMHFSQNQKPHKRQKTLKSVFQSQELNWSKMNKNSCFCGQPQKLPKVKGRTELIGQPARDGLDTWKMLDWNGQYLLGLFTPASIYEEALPPLREGGIKKKKEQQMQNLAALVRVHGDPGVFLCSG